MQGARVTVYLICFYCSRVDVGTDQTVELSDAGYQFLIDLFNRCDKVSHKKNT